MYSFQGSTCTHEYWYSYQGQCYLYSYWYSYHENAPCISIGTHTRGILLVVILVLMSGNVTCTHKWALIPRKLLLVLLLALIPKGILLVNVFMFGTFYFYWYSYREKFSMYSYWLVLMTRGILCPVYMYPSYSCCCTVPLIQVQCICLLLSVLAVYGLVVNWVCCTVCLSSP